MKMKYQSFQDLPPDVAEMLKKRLVDGETKYKPRIPEDASLEEKIRIHQEACIDPSYMQEELEQIVDGFILFNNAVRKGLPNQLYQMMTTTLNMDIAMRAYAAFIIWYAHDGEKSAKNTARQFAKYVIEEIDKRADWDEGQFHDEHFLNRK